MRRKFRDVSRRRPRILTLIFLAAVAALMVLANLSDDMRRRGVGNVVAFDLREPDKQEPQIDISGTWNLSYGWPLMWHQYILYFSPGPRSPGGVVAWRYSPSRLAIDLALCWALLAASGFACEWLLRRYRPRLRWSLRTMLAVVALLAVLFAWFAAARQRSLLQDRFIAAGSVWVQRRGPQWLELFGADRYCRRIVGVKNLGARHFEDDELLQRLRSLPELRYLWIDSRSLTPETARALSGLRQLRVLGIHFHDEQQLSHECLKAVGQMNELEHLALSGAALSSESLASLAGLTELQSLSLWGVSRQAHDVDSDTPLLSRLPRLPRLEYIELAQSDIGDRDLGRLAVLPRLKSLDLGSTHVTDAGLAELASQQSLEELALGGNRTISPAGLKALCPIRRLSKLHLIESMPGESHEHTWLTLDHGPALKALRRSHPEIVVDRHYRGSEWAWKIRASVPPDYIPVPSPRDIAVDLVREWNEK